MPTGKDLIADIDGFSPAPGTCAFWWLGQQGFVVKTADAVIYLDPYLSPSAARRFPPMLAPEEVTNADIIAGTHDHTDHIDRKVWPALAAASPKARFIVPRYLLPQLPRDLDIDAARFVGLDDGASARIGGVTLTGVASAHEFRETDPATGGERFLGYVVESSGVTLYHAGDTCKYEGLEAALKRWMLDVAFLPINGRDARRLRANCIGNMTYQEAADLAGALRPRLTVPAHYDMFAANSEDVRLFSDYMQVKYPHLAVGVCRHGERVELPARGAL